MNRLVWMSPALLLAVSLATPGQAQVSDIEIVGGGVGQPLDIELSGSPGSLGLALLDLVYVPAGLPVPFPIGTVEVGLGLIDFSLQNLTGVVSGQGTATIQVPASLMTPSLDGLTLNFQGIEVLPTTAGSKTGVWRVTVANPGDWDFTLNNMAVPRSVHSTTELLPMDGAHVLVAGAGTATDPMNPITSLVGVADADLYLRNLEETVTIPMSPRGFHRGTRLADGRVLLTGGVDGSGNVTSTTTIFDPSQGTDGLFTSSAPMGTPRLGHTATLLPNGCVLVAGGTTDTSDESSLILSSTSTTELYDPAADAWFAGPAMSRKRILHDARVDANGNVLVSGGASTTLIIIPVITAEAQVYTPASVCDANQPSQTGSFGTSINMPVAMAAHTSTTLDDDRLLLVGGATGSPLLNPMVIPDTTLWDGSAFAVGAPMPTARALGALAPLPNGDVLAAGGAGPGSTLTQQIPTDAVDIYTPAAGAGSWVATNPMQKDRLATEAVLLDDGTVLVPGGTGDDDNDPMTEPQSQATMEVYQP